jgi:hypothetical protein
MERLNGLCGAECFCGQNRNPVTRLYAAFDGWEGVAACRGGGY